MLPHSNLGAALRGLGDLPAARAELIRAIELGDRTLGPDHNEVSIDLEALADVQERLGDLLGAAASLRRAQEIRQRNDGADSPHAVELRDRLHELGSRT